MKTTWLIVSLVFEFLTTSSRGEPTAFPLNENSREYNQHTWRHEHGLPDDRVRAILQTHDGYLWVATQRGLARFDGMKFVVFDHLNTPGVVDDDCKALAEDSDANLWIATQRTLLRERGGECSWYTNIEGAGPFNPISLRGSPSGGIWAATPGWLYRVGGNEIETFSPQQQLPRDRDPSVAVEDDGQGGVWLGTASGLVHVEFNKARHELIPIPNDLGQLGARAVWRSANGEIWVLFTGGLSPEGKLDRKAWIACLKDGEWVKKPELASGEFLANWRATFLTPDASGALWLSAQPNGLHRWQAGQLQFIPMPHVVESDFALCAFSDREGNLWVGTDASGLQRWTPRRVVTYTTGDGLPNENVWSICEAGDGSVLVGTDAGVTRFPGNGFTNLQGKAVSGEADVRSVVEDREGRTWIGTMRDLKYISGTETVQVQLPGEWYERKIRVLLPSRQGGVWIGSVCGLTYWKEGLRIKYSESDGLGVKEIRALLEDREGDLWIGTFGGGLSRLHEGHLTRLSTTNGLSSDNVWALYQDSDGVLWIGTDSGLNRLADGKISAFGKLQGLPDDQVNCIIEDNFGRLWIGYDHGIYWVRKEQFDDVASGRIGLVHAVCYDEADGLLSLETNGQKSNPTACKTRDGRLWFPTTKGVAVIDPSKCLKDDVGPPTVIEQVRANGRIIFGNAPEDHRSISTNRPGISARELTLPPGGARVLEIRFTANTFVAAEKAKFKYRLRGLDDHWIEAGTRREVYFMDLHPGDYVFEVIAANHRGVWHEQAATVAFHLSPFFYQAWWFYPICGVFTGGVLVFSIGRRLRTVRMLHRLEQAEALNEQRKQIARDIHDELGASLTQILRLSQETCRNLSQPDEVSAQNRRIAAVAEEAVDNIGELVWANNPDYDTLEDLVTYLRELVANFFANTTVRVEFDFPQVVPNRSVTGSFRRHILLMVREALQNVTKHSKANLVRVRLAVPDTGLELSISDNGCGMPIGHSISNGNGMRNMRHRVFELGGNLTLQSNPSEGTEIRVMVPLL